MGCRVSKVANEDTVRRCKERRRHMKAAVHARHHLAAAHFDYCRSLLATGSALSNFGAGEPLSISHDIPAVLLPTPSTTTATEPHPPPRSATTRHHPTPPPAPPIHIPCPSRQPSPPTPTPTAALPASQRRKKKPMKLPHIVSDSSTFSLSPPKKPVENTHFTYHARANSTYSTTPSQDGSSIWDWEKFYPPPPPPDSEYFQHLHTNKDNNNESDLLRESAQNTSDSQCLRNYKHVDNRYSEDYDKASSYSSFQNHWGKERIETERVEVECSEWGDDHQHHHCSSTTSSDLDGDDEKDDDDDTDFRSTSDLGTGSSFSEAVGGGNGKGGSFGSSNRNVGVNDSGDGGSSSMSWGKAEGAKELVSDTRTLVRHKDLAEIAAVIKECFDKAAAAGELVSEMLEAGRAQLDHGFRQLKKTVYHSSGLLSKLSSSWTLKPPLAVKYSFEPCSIELAAGPKSLCSTLDRLFAWEKKLYEEVKAREGAKTAHEKKLSTLQSQEARREEEAKLDKTKASIKRLQSLIVVTSQAVSATSSSIIGLRDSELVPQLVELCHGFMYMWRSMNQFHEVQKDIVQQVRGLVNRSTKESTSDLHQQATHNLESAVSAWHSSFCRLIKFQRDFIRSLHGWFWLSLIPVNNEPNNGKREPSEAFGFCDEWKLALDRIPDTFASEAIKSFINVVHSISLKQTEELKIKKRTESASKELEKKAASLRNIDKKYYNSYSMVGLGLPDPGQYNGHVLDARDPLSEKKAELAACQRRVEDEMLKHSMAVEVTRASTLNNIQTGLPGVFQAMTSFSSLIMEALEAVCTRSYAIK